MALFFGKLRFVQILSQEICNTRFTTNAPSPQKALIVMISLSAVCERGSRQANEIRGPAVRLELA